MRSLTLYRPSLFLYFLLLFGYAVMSYSCNKEEDDPEQTGNDTIKPPNHEEGNDYEWDEATVIEIRFNLNKITASSPSVTINGKKALISEAGNYRISGSITDGQIIVNAPDDARIRLLFNNMSIQSNTGPAIIVENSKKTIVFLQEGTRNSLADWPSYPNPDADPNAAFFSESDLTIFGTGQLNVIGNFRDGITSEDGLLIKSGTIEVQAADDGIRGKDYLTIEDGNITVNAGGDGLTSDDEGNETTGIVFIDGGKINVTSNGDGISAFNKFTSEGGFLEIIAGGGHLQDTSANSQKGIKTGNQVILNLDSCRIDAVDHAVDSDGSIEVQDGSYLFYTARTGLHSNVLAMVNEGNISIVRAIEGIESKLIRINGGNLRITTTDDGFSATDGYDVEFDDGSLIEINGGYLYFNPLNGDGLDSNGDIHLKNGNVIIHGPREAPEVAIDCNDDFNISGGMLIASGTGSQLIDFPDSTSTQNSLVAIFAELIPESTLFHIRDNQGNAVITFQPEGQFQSVIFSSPTLASSATYEIFLNGSFAGQFVDGVSFENIYSPGDQIASFTINEQVTVLNNLEIDTDELN